MTHKRHSGVHSRLSQRACHACMCVCVYLHDVCIRTDFSRSDYRGRSFHFNSRLTANVRPITSRIARSREEASEVTAIRRPKRCVCACRIARRDATRRDAQSLHYSTEKDYTLIRLITRSGGR